MRPRRLEPHHPARESTLVDRLDDEVKMVGLGREVHELEVPLALRFERRSLPAQVALHDSLQHLMPERRQPDLRKRLLE